MRYSATEFGRIKPTNFRLSGTLRELDYRHGNHHKTAVKQSQFSKDMMERIEGFTVVAAIL